MKDNRQFSKIFKNESKKRPNIYTPPKNIKKLKNNSNKTNQLNKSLPNNCS